MDSYERASDGMALAEIRNQPGFLALERLIKVMRDDLFAKWTSTPDLTKDYCKGALEVLDTLVPSIDELITWAEQYRAQERQFSASTRGTAIDGQGTGDLAI